MVNIETISPAEYSKIGSQLTILYGFQETMFGGCLIAAMKDSKKSICHLAFIGEEKEKGLNLFKKKWHLSHLIENKEDTKSIAEAIFNKIQKKGNNSLNVILKGTDFQISVWKALTRIPMGSCVTYEQVANMIENPRAVRAVANALAANQVGYLIPCHRVVCKNGCNKFSWGAKVKEKMQNFEKEA